MLEKLIGWLKGLFFRRKAMSIGIYGATNAGKTTLANRICLDLVGEPVGSVSVIPHETRTVQKKEQVEIKTNGLRLSLNILDMPGVAVKVDYRDFLPYGLTTEEAQVRAKEATRGIIEAVRWLENVDTALLVIDATEDPYSQVNLTLLGNLEARDIPVILVANKLDIRGASLAKVREAFPQYEIVGVSAQTGENIPRIYETIASRMK
jgi:small GTP-binding protein